MTLIVCKTNLLLLLPGTKHCIPSIAQLLHTLSPASLTRSLRSTSHRTFRLLQFVHAIEERFFFSGTAVSPPSIDFLFFDLAPGDCGCDSWAPESSPIAKSRCSSSCTADCNKLKDAGSIVLLLELCETCETRKRY